MMDDAHGIGVMGENGRGTAEYHNCLGQVDIITGTFSKSFGCVGGFVAASKKLIQYLRYYADSKCLFRCNNSTGSSIFIKGFGTYTDTS